jgi:hypothetical protein
MKAIVDIVKVCKRKQDAAVNTPVPVKAVDFPVNFVGGKHREFIDPIIAILMMHRDSVCVIAIDRTHLI